jgi:hypothetical protein
MDKRGQANTLAESINVHEDSVLNTVMMLALPRLLYCIPALIRAALIHTAPSHNEP